MNNQKSTNRMSYWKIFKFLPACIALAPDGTTFSYISIATPPISCNGTHFNPRHRVHIPLIGPFKWCPRRNLRPAVLWCCWFLIQCQERWEKHIDQESSCFHAITSWHLMLMMLMTRGPSDFLPLLPPLILIWLCLSTGKLKFFLFLLLILLQSNPRLIICLPVLKHHFLSVSLDWFQGNTTDEEHF